MSEDIFAGVRDFVKVAQEGSFTAAALSLGVTGSALSKSVMRLESRLGTKLLHRTTRRVSLTNDGEAYLESCMQAMAVLEETENCMSTGHQTPVGRLRIDLPAAFGRRHVLPELLKLTARHSRLDLTVTFSERTIDLINDGVDMVVRIGELQDNADLVARRLGEQRLVICASPEYLAERGVPQTKEELASHSCVIGWRRGQRHTWILRDKNGATESFDIPVRHEMGDGDAMLAATLAGCGLAQLPTWLVKDHLANGELITVLGDLSGGEMPIHVVWVRSNYFQPRLRVVVDELLRIAQLPDSGFHVPV
ncbi:LysR family transcriptional regulator [Pseudomonas sp. NPDC089752]|uniref:LysR family transcriptional regulator n=1 Tax=Pseudomonas sp. NPDC089752 TaxID=3364472 RepID=UPI00381349C2